MATTHSAARSRLTRGRQQKPRAFAVHGRLRSFIESEQEQLGTTKSLLECVAHSIEHAGQPASGPYYPDLLLLATDLIGQRITNLDDLLLDGRLPDQPPR